MLRIQLATVALGLALGGSLPVLADDTVAVADKTAIKTALKKGCEAFIAGDIPGSMAPYSKSVFLFDIAPPYKTDFDHLQAANAQLRAAMTKPPTCDYEEMVITIINRQYAYAHYILPYSAELKGGQKITIQGRGTDIFQKQHGTWKIVHEHFSVPVDPITGKAELVPAP